MGNPIKVFYSLEKENILNVVKDSIKTGTKMVSDNLQRYVGISRSFEVKPIVIP